MPIKTTSKCFCLNMISFGDVLVFFFFYKELIFVVNHSVVIIVYAAEIICHNQILKRQKHHSAFTMMYERSSQNDALLVSLLQTEFSHALNEILDALDTAKRHKARASF